MSMYRILGPTLRSKLHHTVNISDFQALLGHDRRSQNLTVGNTFVSNKNGPKNTVITLCRVNSQ